jgi:hypothetical protein
MLRNNEQLWLVPITPNASPQTENDDKVNNRVTGKHGNSKQNKKKRAQFLTTLDII